MHRLQPLSRLTQERPDHLSQALGLFKREATTGVLDLFDSHAWVEAAQFRCHLERDDGLLSPMTSRLGTSIALTTSRYSGLAA